MTNENIQFTPVSKNAHKHPFDFRLFLEGMRQLRTFAIVILIVLSLEAILVPVSNAINYATNRGGFDSWVTPAEIEDVKQTTTPIDYHPFIVGVYLLAAPIMTLMLFGFLNKRNTSDFYHSIPYTRVCLHFSYFAAIMAWVVILAFGSTLLSLITQWILGDFYIPLTAYYFLIGLSVTVCSFFVAAVFLLAMTVTGTAFSNVVIALLIMFAPTILFSILSESLSSFLPIVPSGKMIGFLSPSNNIVTASASLLFESLDYLTASATLVLESIDYYYSPYSIFYSWKAILYTGVSAVLALALGALLFCFRKSETASQSAPNRKVQAVFRIALITVFCSISLGSIFDNLMRGRGIGDFSYVIFFIAALVLYCLYELISTKKWKNVLKALPGYLIVLVLCGVILGGMYLVYRNQINFTPSADELKSISVYPASYNFSMYNGKISLDDYYTLHSEEIRITDPEALKVAAEALKENAEILKADNDGTIYGNYHCGSYNEYFNFTYYGKDSPQYGQQKYSQYTLKFRTGGKTRTRVIYVNTEKAETFINALSENEDYKKLYSELPDAVGAYFGGRFRTMFSEEEAMRIYDIMKFEVASADFSEWYSCIKTSDSMYDINNFRIIAQVSSGFYPYGVEIPVVRKFMPQTYEKMMMILTENMREEKKEFEAFLTSEKFGNDSDTCYYYAKVEISNLEYLGKTYFAGIYAGIDDGWSTPDTLNELMNLSDESKSLDFDEPYLYFILSYSFADEEKAKSIGEPNRIIYLPLKDSVTPDELTERFNAKIFEMNPID